MEQQISALYQTVQPFIPAIKQAYSLYQVIEQKPTLEYNPELIEKQRKYVEEARQRLGLADHAKPVSSAHQDESDISDNLKTTAGLSTTTAVQMTSTASSVPAAATATAAVQPQTSSLPAAPTMATTTTNTNAMATDSMNTSSNMGAALQAAMLMDPSFMRMLMEPSPIAPAPVVSPASGLVNNVNVSDYGTDATRLVGRQQVGLEPVLSYKDQQVFMARMSQLFASLKQLISMYEQERMNWVVSMDQITREIAFITTLLRQDPRMMGTSFGSDKPT